MILRAAVDQQKTVSVQGAVAFVGDPIMHHGPMWARSADGVKADVMQQIGGGAAVLKLGYNVNFSEMGGVGPVKPSQKPHLPWKYWVRKFFAFCQLLLLFGYSPFSLKNRIPCCNLRRAK